MGNELMHVMVKPAVGILVQDRACIGDVLSELSKVFGPHDIVGEWRDFSHSNYYAEEMGERLSRCFVSYERLVRGEDAAKFKSATSAVEDKFRVDGKRRANVDAGYIDANKFVLMTGKHGGHKIAVANGVWADLLLWYNKGWEAMPWAFPDFRDGGHFETFVKMRRRYKEQVKLLSS
jgi:hypothetical protein